MDNKAPCVNNATCVTLNNRTEYCRCAPGFLGEYCQHKDPCQPGYCLNGGNCSVSMSAGVPVPGSATCSCPLGYAGQHCQIPQNSTCYPNNPCANRGICTLLPFDKYKCECARGWTGPGCEYEDSCLSSPCANGGTCSTLSGGSYTCSCLPGYTGRHCLNDTDECAATPSICQNEGTCINTRGSYKCMCALGFTGKHCESSYIPCSPSPCLNGGTCNQNSETSYSCHCLPGFNGTNCENNIDDCPGHQCANRGTCIDGVNTYNCQCPPEWTGFGGTHCENELNECLSSPCLNRGKCLDQVSRFVCECPAGFSGEMCQIDIDECSKPCHHGQCKDGIATFSCECYAGYTGAICNIQVQECHSNPCQNRGRCIDLVNAYQCNCPPGISGRFTVKLFSSTSVHLNTSIFSTSCWVNCEINEDDCASNLCVYGECQDGINEYKCVCSPGYTGDKCDVDINECSSNPCMSGGTCVDNVNGFHCLCPPSTYGLLCLSGTDHCVAQPCVHGKCIEQQNGYFCQCEAGWVGQHCEQEKDECLPNPCQNGGSCLDRHNGFTCVCQAGYRGVNCEKNIDECTSGPCLNQGICIDGLNSYTCQCVPPFAGEHCEVELDPCSSRPCQRGGVCLPSADYTYFTCRCPAGWQGLCLSDVNECKKNPCRNGGHCINSPGSYICKCPSGYSGHNCQTDIDDCSPSEVTIFLWVTLGPWDYFSATFNLYFVSSALDPCLNGGSCVDDVGSFSCECRPGFEGEHCEIEADECASQPCRNGAICRDYVNSFVCECRLGFDGILCDHNILECTESSCLNNGTCIDDINTFSCRCLPGFFGTFCEYEQNECDSQPCKNGGTCTDGLGTYRCTCPAGYNGQNCQNYVNLCRQVRCHNGGSCSHTGATSWTCHCTMGWTGPYCDVPDMSCRDFAARKGLEEENVCKNAGRCVNVGNSHKCECQPGYTGSYCEEMVDECKSNPCRNGATCKDYQGTYECICKPGYQGVNCEYEVDECHSKPCLHGGTCINLINRFTCVCPSGTHGVQCEVNVDDCAPKPGSWEPRCLNGGQCLDGIGRYTCSCPPGFVGEHCEGDLNECLSGPCHATGSLDCVQLVNDYQCRCRLGYTGREIFAFFCTIPCRNGGVCSMNMTSVHGYMCSCPPGFIGFNCGEIEGYTCAKLHCQNGGRCVESAGGHLYCQCQQGFSGAHCENSQWCPWPCQNGGTCMKDSANPVQYSCHCPNNFSGRYCENNVVGSGPSTCPYLQCKHHSADKVCDAQCNNHECDWDGGDCSLNWKQPWSNCTASVSCWDLFKNGRCDKECDNPGCLFDGFECQKHKTCKYVYEKYCADHFGNKICDPSCYTKACGWDGLDCAGDTPAKIVPGTLVIVVLLQPKELLGDLRGFLRSLGALLYTNLQVKLDENNKPMVYPYFGVENHGQQLKGSRSKRELEKEVIGSVVHLEIDNRKCSESSGECFSKTEEVASFLAAAHIKLFVPYCGNHLSSFPPVSVVILLLIVVLGMLAAKRKHKHGLLWLPDGFMANKNDKRREPVGQDDFDLKNFKTQDGAVLDGGQSQRWLEDEVPPRKPRLEGKPLLPMAMDGGVDRREWTRQHRKAADISLTPPQAELDSDGVDVNVKGPDGFTPLMLASLRNGGVLDCNLHGDEEEESGGDEPGSSVISDLISQGASLIAQTDRTGETALHLAARYARADAAKRLLDAGADPNAHDNMGRTPLHAAVAADAQGVFQILIRNRATELDSRMNDGTTPLILAARLAVEGMVEELIHCHADINAVDDHGKSALHWAAAVNNVEATLVLLKNGANRDMQDNKEETPLFLAAREGSFEAAQVLLDHYSNRDITDHMDRLPRDTAQERMHHDIVRLLDQYNVVHSPHNGPNLMGGAGNPSMMCGANGAGFMNVRSGGPGASAGAGGASGGAAANGVNANGVKTAGALPESSVTMSPVDSLESPHSFLGDVSGTVSTTANSPPLLSSPTTRPMLPPVSHMLGQQQGWVGTTKHPYSDHMFSLIPHQIGGSHTGMGHSRGPMFTPMNVTMSREQLPPIVTFQMMAPGGGQGMLKQSQTGQVQVTQSQNQSHSQQGPGHLHCAQSMMYQMNEQMGIGHGLPHTVQHPHTIGHGHAGMEGQSRQLPSYQPMQSPVDKYPTPPSQHSYTTTGSEGTTPGHSAHPPSEHPYLTPSPDSPDPWSSSSPHSNSDWSDITTSPTPLGNPHHTLPSSHRTHIPEQVQLQPQSQQIQQSSQQPQLGNMQVIA
uniref:Notch receptor 2 n=1 Tax=Takifugu rubripes TaxID=31033 RepID=A0A674MY80_TAKRU